MATELLLAIGYHNPKPTRTFLHDAESLGWVFLYAIYKHGIRDSHLEDDLNLKNGLKAEFEEIFSAPDVRTLSTKRLAIPLGRIALERPNDKPLEIPRSIQWLIRYVRVVARREGALVGSAMEGVLTTWDFLAQMIQNATVLPGRPKADNGLRDTEEPTDLNLDSSGRDSPMATASDSEHVENTPMLPTPSQATTTANLGPVALEQRELAARIFTEDYRTWVVALAAMEHVLSGGSKGSWQAMKRDILEDIASTKVRIHIK